VDLFAGQLVDVRALPDGADEVELDADARPGIPAETSCFPS
jgi:hypothetical protein